jgi:hypothetical protein
MVIVIVCVSIVNNDKIFIMETYDSECYIITVKDIISNRTILEGEIISAKEKVILLLRLFHKINLNLCC